MSVTVDSEIFPSERLGCRTIGQVLSQIQGNTKLVVRLLVDGQAPEAAQMADLRRRPLDGLTIYIETADPRRLALDVLDEVGRQIPEAEELRTTASEMLGRGQLNKALQQLGSCLRIWQDAQEAVLKVAELLRLPLDTLRAEGEPVASVVHHFTLNLREVRSALQRHDFVALSDTLLYEMADSEARWQSVIQAMTAAVRGIGN